MNDWTKMGEAQDVDTKSCAHDQIPILSVVTATDHLKP